MMKESSNRPNRSSGRSATKASRAVSPNFVDDLPMDHFGHIDLYGHLQESAGWWFVGWMPRPFIPEDEVEVPVRWVSAQGHVDTVAVMAFYERPDLDQRRIGVVIHVMGGRQAAFGLKRLLLLLDGATYGVQTSLSTIRPDDRTLYDSVRPTLVFQALESAGRERLRQLTAQPGFLGLDTLSAMAATVQLEIDEAIACPPHGLLLKGWCVAVPGRVKALRIRAGGLSATIDLADVVPVPRPDVIQAVGSAFGSDDPQVGFVAYVSDLYSETEPVYLEVELDTGERGHKAVKLSRKRGVEAIRSVLEGIDCRFADVDHHFDRVLGPAVTALNADRLAQPQTVDHVDYGAGPANPSCTLVIPLYGRTDYLEYQMALWSADATSRTLELIYVLDDPTKRTELLILAESVYARFKLPFRVLLCSANRGFGPASNLGLAAARAPYVAFVNSDVFPITHGWTDRLIAVLKRNPRLGAIGPRLLYEDGSVQHEGCYFRTLPEYADWTFVEHSNKGRRPAAVESLLAADMITAACLLLSTKLARELKGFDERYVIGDFEDADLCRRILDKKLGLAVDPTVNCHHLERQSQSRLDGHWRMNLTLFNAWVHQRRWISPSSPSGDNP